MMTRKNYTMVLHMSTHVSQIVFKNGIRTSIHVRHLNLESPRESSQQQKSLNWLIKPDREKTETTSTIQMGVEEKLDIKPEMAEKTKKGTFYHEKIILGYSAEQMCDLVGNVAKYKEFLPFCINSEILPDETK